ncbi:MAG: formylglycine-generating enzyme family protein, partial [Verrucomicrobiota bacterium]
MSKDQDTDSIFNLPPATRSALIISGFLLSGIILTMFWVGREAFRIKRQRDATAQASRSLSGEMLWLGGGKFTMGATDGQPDEQPLHDVKV